MVAKHKHASGHGHGGAAAHDTGRTPGKHTQTAHLGAHGDGAATDEAETAKLLEDNDRYEGFVQTFAYYAGRTESTEQASVGDATLDDVLRQVREAAIRLATSDQSLDAIQRWDTIRSKVVRAIGHAKSIGIDDAMVAQANLGVRKLDNATAQQRVDEMMSVEEGEVDGADPDLAMLAPAAHMLDKALDQVDALRSAAMSAAEAGAGGMGAKVEGAFAVFKGVYTVWTETPELGKKIDRLRKHGGSGLTKTATVLQVIQYVTEVVGSAVTAINGLAELAFGAETHEVGEAFAELAGKAAKNDLEKLSGVLGFAVSVLDICVGAINLFQAIKKGDVPGEISAAAQITSGALGIGLLATGAGLVDTGMIMGMVMVEANGVMGIYQTYEIEKAIMKDAYLQKIATVVELASGVAQEARSMAAAKMLIESGASSGALDVHLQGNFDDRLGAQFTAHADAVNQGLTALGPMVRSITNDDAALATAMGSKGLQGLDDELGRSSYTTLPYVCQDVFQGISRMGALAMQKYGPAQAPDPAQAPQNDDDQDGEVEE